MRDSGVVEQVDRGTTSVNNYGAIPNFTSGKIRDARLSQMRTIFTLFKHHGISTHVVELGEGEGILVREVRVRDLPLLSPSLKDVPRQVGLEVLVRTRLSKKTIRRIEAGEIPRDQIVLAEGEEFVPGARLATPYVEFSAKWIDGDPYLSDRDAMIIGRMGSASLDKLRDFGARIGRILSEFCEKAGYDLVDFKIEVAIDPVTGDFMLIDALSLDEMGLMKDGVEYGKNPIRNYYKINHPDWVKALNEAIEAGLPKEEWPKMPPLPEEEMQAHEVRYGWAADDFKKALAAMSLA